MNIFSRFCLVSLTVLALVVGYVTGLAVLPAAAVTGSTTINGVTYTIDSQSQSPAVAVTSYVGAGGAISLLSTVTIDSVVYPVTSIGDDAFREDGLTSVTIPDSVITIGLNAFRYNGLTSVVIPDSVTSIGEAAFGSNLLTSVTLGAAVPTIGDRAFITAQLSSLVIPDSVTAIGSYAFLGDMFGRTLASVTLGDHVQTIGVAAFAFGAFSSVTIPASVTDIGQDAFSDGLLSSVLMLGSPPNIGAWALDSTSITTVYHFASNAQGFTSPWNDYATRQIVGWLQFDSNGHGAPPGAQAFETLSPAVHPGDPSQGEFTLQGWYTERVGGTQWNFATAVVGVVTVYAQWGVAFPATASVTISGTSKVGETLTAVTSTWDPEPTFSYA